MSAVFPIASDCGLRDMCMPRNTSKREDNEDERSAVQIAADGLEMIARFSSTEMDALVGELLKRCEQKKKRPRADSWALAQRAFIKLQSMLDEYGTKSMKHITSRSIERELLSLVRDVAEAGDDLSPFFARIDAASVRLRRLRRLMEELSHEFVSADKTRVTRASGGGNHP